jgi:hypothetical protein
VCWLLLTLAIVAMSLPRLGTGTWVWRAGVGSASEIGGRVLEWEWYDLGQSAWLAEADPRWHVRGRGYVYSQNLSRFLPGLAVSWLSVFTRDAWLAAVVATCLCWIAATLATYAICRRLMPARAAPAAIAAALVALGPGFTAFVGNIDVHPFGYAAAACGLLFLLHATAHDAPATHAAPPSAAHRPDGILAGVVLAVMNATLELGVPLLSMLWLSALVRDARGASMPADGLARRGWRQHHWIKWAAAATVVFAGLQAAWWGIAIVVLRGQIETHNDVAELAAYAFSQASSAAPGGWLRETAHVWWTAFTWPVAVAALWGIVAAPRPVRCWALAWIGLVAAGTATTRLHPRTVYLAYPAVYALAAAAVDWAATRASRAGPATWSRRVAPLIAWVVPVLFVGLVARLVLGDLAGDLTLVKEWWR